MSPLKGIVETLDEVEEPYRELYRESDKGGYRLDAEGIEFAPDVEALKSKARSEARIRQNLEKELAKIPKDFDRDKWEELVALAGANGNGAPDSDDDKDKPPPKPDNAPDVKKIRESLEGRYKETIETLQKQVEAFEQKDQKRALNDDLSKAVEEVGITDPVYKKAVMALMKERGANATLDNGDYKTVIEDELGETRSIAAYMKEWAKTEEAEAFLPASGATGGGATGSAPNTRPGTVRSKADFKSREQMYEYIEKHGKEGYTALPGTLPEGLGFTR